MIEADIPTQYIPEKPAIKSPAPLEATQPLTVTQAVVTDEQGNQHYLTWNRDAQAYNDEQGKTPSDYKLVRESDWQPLGEGSAKLEQQQPPTDGRPMPDAEIPRGYKEVTVEPGVAKETNTGVSGQVTDSTPLTETTEVIIQGPPIQHTSGLAPKAEFTPVPPKPGDYVSGEETQ